MNKKEDKMKDMVTTNAADSSFRPLNKEEREMLKIISENLLEPIEEADVYLDLFELGINSITFILIVVDLESAYEIEFDDKMLELENVSSIKMLIEYVCEKKSVKAQ